MEVQLLQEIHEVRQEYNTACLNRLHPLYSLLRHFLNDSDALDDYDAHAVLSQLLQHFEQRIVGSTFDQVLVATRVVRISELLESMLEEVYITLVIVDEEGENIRRLNETLQLGFLVSCESYRIQAVVVHDVDHVEYLAVDVDIDQLRLLRVVALQVVKTTLHLKPVLNGEQVKDFENKFEATHLQSTRLVVFSTQTLSMAI